MTTKEQLLDTMAKEAAQWMSYRHVLERLDAQKPEGFATLMVDMTSRNYDVLIFLGNFYHWLEEQHDKYGKRAETIRDELKDKHGCSKDDFLAAATAELDVNQTNPQNIYIDHMLENNELVEVPAKYKKQLLPKKHRALTKHEKLLIDRALLRPKGTESSNGMILTIDLDALSPFHQWCALNMMS